MALELAAGIDAEATVLTVAGTLPADLEYGYEFRIGDELLTFERYEPDRTLMAGKSSEVPFAPIPSLLVWQVRRGQGGSAAASHLAAASLVGVNEANVSGATTAKPAPWPTGTGGGAVDSVNTQTGVVVLDAGDLATAVAPGPTVEDTLGALLAGKVSKIDAPALDVAASVATTATGTGTGSATADRNASSVDADSTASGYAQASGVGNAVSTNTASSLTGVADAGAVATTTGGTGIARLEVSDGAANPYFYLRVIAGVADVNTNIFYSEVAGAVGADFVTLLRRDTTAETGGLYAWTGSAYVQVSGAV